MCEICRLKQGVNEITVDSARGNTRTGLAVIVSGLLKNAFFRSRRGNEAQISLETIIRLEPPYVGCYFFNGLSGPKVAQPARLAVSNPELVKILAACISPANKRTINAARPLLPERLFWEYIIEQPLAAQQHRPTACRKGCSGNGNTSLRAMGCAILTRLLIFVQARTNRHYLDRQ